MSAGFLYTPTCWSERKSFIIMGALSGGSEYGSRLRHHFTHFSGARDLGPATTARATVVSLPIVLLGHFDFIGVIPKLAISSAVVYACTENGDSDDRKYSSAYSSEVRGRRVCHEWKKKNLNDSGNGNGQQVCLQTPVAAAPTIGGYSTCAVLTTRTLLLLSWLWRLCELPRCIHPSNALTSNKQCNECKS
ncbi:hypothetical protein TSMEX_011260 [Taenia solium]|eukprot:TsM_000313400 transcript=TsM_000313400 gene=TsM_000313400